MAIISNIALPQPQCQKRRETAGAIVCRNNISANTTIELDAELLGHINKFNFSTVSLISLDTLLQEPGIKLVLHKDFGVPQDAPPAGNVPTNYTSTARSQNFSSTLKA